MTAIEKPVSAYLAAEGFTNELVHEIGEGNVIDVFDRLVLARSAPKCAIWADNIWRNPDIAKIESIGDAAKKLRSVQRNWANYAFDFHRRSSLVTEKLPHLSAKPLVFGAPLPPANLGSWSLLAPDLMIFSADCSAPVSNGAYDFVENKEEPPNRAYLKLWEALTRIGKMPQPGETCVDLGACPGGWTWVLQKLGSSVISVDKAPLEPRIAALSNVTCRAESAFALAPADIGRADWVFSDIICYPDRLLRLVTDWKKSGLVKNMVCTIKFQGETDHDAIARFLEISGSFAMHLYNNKHEITWVSLAP